MESRECRDLIILDNFSLAALCGSYYKWEGHKGKYGDQFGPSFSSPAEKWQWLGPDWQHKFGEQCMGSHVILERGEAPLADGLRAISEQT